MNPPTIEDILLFIELDRAVRASLTPILPGPGELRDHSPERLLTFTWDKSADIWAFGALLIYLLSGRHPFDATGHIGDHLVLLREQVRWFDPGLGILTRPSKTTEMPWPRVDLVLF